MRKRVASVLTAGIILTLGGVFLAAQEKIQPVELRLVPFSHLDLSWLGTQKEVESRFSEILTAAIEKARANPDYRFFIDNVYLVERYMTLHPERTPLLKELVAKGQLEINPQWAIPHTDDNTGEGVVRNIFYAKKFVKENFGVASTVLSYSDLPEWMVQTPQILRGSGIEFVVMTRLGPPGVPLVWWQGLDGSRVLTASIGYGGTALMTRGITVDAGTMKATGFGELLKKAAGPFKGSPLVSSLGSDLFLPVKNLERNVEEWNAQSEDVKIRLSTFREYYEKVKGRLDLPIVSGEVPDPWVGYKETVFAQTWQDEQKAANLLLTAEKLATASHLLGSRHYPGAAVAEAWNWLARAADHNYVGIGGREGDEVKVGLRQKALFAAQDIIDRSVSFLAERVKVPGRPCIPLVVFNPLSWRRTDLVAAHVTFYPDIESLARNVDWKAYPGLPTEQARVAALLAGADTWPIGKNDKMVLEDAEGKQVQFQETFTWRSVGKGEAYLLFLAEDVPPLGYKTYYLYPSKEERRAPGAVKAEEGGLENQYLRVNINPATGAFSLLEKGTGKVLVNGATVVLETYADASVYRSGKPPTPLPVKLNRVEILERGPVRARLRLLYAANHPGIQALYTDLSLTTQSRLDVESTIKYDDSEVKDILIAGQLFPLALKKPQFHYGAPYGHSAMTNIRPGLLEQYSPGADTAFLPAEFFKISRSIQQWLAVSGDGMGFTIASNRRLFALTDDHVKCVMLGVTPPEPQRAEVLHSGKVVSRFTMTPLSGSWQEAKAYRSGWESNSPLISYSVENAVGDKTLPASLSFLSASSDHAIVTVLKKAEEGEGVIVRLFEAEGREGKTGLTFFRPVREAWVANLLEEKQAAASPGEVTLGKNEIKTVRFRLQE